MSVDRFRPETVALLLCDLQNDFIHPDGAYARGGQIRARSHRGAAGAGISAADGSAAGSGAASCIATQFTLVPGRAW
jgi:ureidoacrylate peracid hydrolase